MQNKPELLSPAGDWERLQMAVNYGADSVYLAGKIFGMRASAGNFEDEELAKAVSFCHQRGVKVFVTCNTLPRNYEVAMLPQYLEMLDNAGADSLIVADLGVFMAAQKYAPHVKLHVSTQTGITNYSNASAWFDLGASRVVLARELSLDEIRELRQKTPKELEIEAFVHGAMCVSFSGRCLLSNYMTGRDANRGQCAQPCRWKYHLMEEKRPGEYFEIFEDGGTHILNSKDMCMIGHIRELYDAGITSFKIEGRMKSAYYAAVITNAYRHAIDQVFSGVPIDPIWLEEVDKVSHRNYCTGFYFGDNGQMQYYNDSKYIRNWDVAAYVVKCESDGQAVLTQRNRFWKGDTLELLTPSGPPVAFTVGDMQNADGQSIDCCPHPEMEIRTRLPVQCPPLSILRRKSDK